MRLSESQIIEGLNHQNVFVRDVVLHYFGDCKRTQVDITGRVIEAVEQFGWKEAFLWPHRIAKFQLDARTLPWVLSQLERSDEGGPDGHMPSQLAGMVAQAPIEILRPELPRIMGLDIFHDEKASAWRPGRTTGEVIGLRVEMADVSAEDCWEKLLEYCEDVADVEVFSDADIPYAELLVERILSQGNAYAPHVLQMLAREFDSLSMGEEWLMGLMIGMAGKLRLEEAIGPLYELFKVDWDWFNEEIHSALVSIGTPAVGSLVCRNYADGGSCERIYTQGILEAVHYPSIIEDMLPLLEVEEEDDMRVRLGVAFASHFDEAGLQPALDIYEEWPEDPERLTILRRLFAFSSLAELQHPQQDQWQKKIEDDWQRYEATKDNMDFDLLDLFERSYKRFMGAELDDDSFSFESVPEEAWNTKQEPIVQSSPRIGRNEPCPCGSGKKYKRCCLRVGNP